MLATFCCVEDLPVKALAAVLPWTWETFGEYLDAIDQGLGMNMAPLVGHNPLRLRAMGQAAWERAATADETPRCSACSPSPSKPARGGGAPTRRRMPGRPGEPVPSGSPTTSASLLGARWASSTGA